MMMMMMIDGRRCNGVKTRLFTAQAATISENRREQISCTQR